MLALANFFRPSVFEIGGRHADVQVSGRGSLDSRERTFLIALINFTPDDAFQHTKPPHSASIPFQPTQRFVTSEKLLCLRTNEASLDFSLFISYQSPNIHRQTCDTSNISEIWK